MDKLIEEMTLEELNLLSAQLHDEYYAVKDRIKAVQQWRNKRGLEADAKRNLAEAESQYRKLSLDPAKVTDNVEYDALKYKLEVLQAELEAERQKPPPIMVAPESIKSDEAVVGTGGQIRRWLAKATGVKR